MKCVWCNCFWFVQLCHRYAVMTCSGCFKLNPATWYGQRLWSEPSKKEHHQRVCFILFSRCLMCSPTTFVCILLSSVLSSHMFKIIELILPTKSERQNGKKGKSTTTPTNQRSLITDKRILLSHCKQLRPIFFLYTIRIQSLDSILGATPNCSTSAEHEPNENHTRKQQNGIRYGCM